MPLGRGTTAATHDDYAIQLHALRHEDKVQVGVAVYHDRILVRRIADTTCHNLVAASWHVSDSVFSFGI